jgi:hypothetical protein
MVSRKTNQTTKSYTIKLFYTNSFSIPLEILCACRPPMRPTQVANPSASLPFSSTLLQPPPKQATARAVWLAKMAAAGPSSRLVAWRGMTQNGKRRLARAAWGSARLPGHDCGNISQRPGSTQGGGDGGQVSSLRRPLSLSHGGAGGAGLGCCGPSGSGALVARVIGVGIHRHDGAPELLAGGYTCVA